MEPSNGSNVIPRRARPGLAGLDPHRASVSGAESLQVLSLSRTPKPQTSNPKLEFSSVPSLQVVNLTMEYKKNSVKKKPICPTQLILGPFVLQIWSRHPLKLRGKENFEAHRVDVMS